MFKFGTSGEDCYGAWCVSCTWSESFAFVALPAIQRSHTLVPRTYLPYGAHRPPFQPSSLGIGCPSTCCCVRFLRCFKDSIPAAIATAFGEDPPVSAPHQASMHPPPPQSPQVWGSSIWSSDNSSSRPGTTRSSVARTPAQVPSWLTTALGSTSAVSPATPLLVRAWCGDSDIFCCGTGRWGLLESLTLGAPVVSNLAGEDSFDAIPQE